MRMDLIHISAVIMRLTVALGFYLPLYRLLPRFLNKVCFLAFTAFLVSRVNAEVQVLYPVFQDRLFTVRSLTLCDSVMALINLVTALACSAGCFKVMC